MHKTAAPSGIVLGLLLGLLVWLWSRNDVLGIIAMVGLPIACWNLIRLAETGLAAAISAGVKGVSNASKRHRQAKTEAITQSIPDRANAATGTTPYQPGSTQIPSASVRTAQPNSLPSQLSPDVIYCRQCGHPLPAQAKFCNVCGAPVERTRV